MPNREAYNSCMRPYISGTGITQVQRRANFCIGAKICTGKAKTPEEAARICASQPAKPPKERTSRRGINPNQLAECVLPNLPQDPTVYQLASAIGDCIGRRAKTEKSSKNSFIKGCVLEKTVRGTFAESVGLQKKCAQEWMQKQGAI